MTMTHHFANRIIRFMACGLLALSLTACDRTVNDIRLSRFNQPALEPLVVKPTSLAVNLQAASNGRGLNAASLEALNSMLNRQGRLAKQTLTITPYTARGEQLAARLSIALRNAGASPQKVTVQSRAFPGSIRADLSVQSQAIAVQTSRCRINDPDKSMVAPFEGVGYLGCANQNNLAMMVSDPRDLIQARSLDDADGRVAVGAIERYQNDEVKDLIDIDFSED